jgi:hypothetical protein
VHKGRLCAHTRANADHLSYSDIAVVDIKEAPEKPDYLDAGHRSSPQRRPHLHGQRAAYPGTPGELWDVLRITRG